GLRGDGLLARLARCRLAELIEATCQSLLQSLVLLRVECGSQRLLDQCRLGAVAVLGDRPEFASERMCEGEGGAVLAHLKTDPRKLNGRIELAAADGRVTFAVVRGLSCSKERQIGERALGLLLLSPAAGDGAREPWGRFLRALSYPKLASLKAGVWP